MSFNPSTYEERQSLYLDVEALISPGFLTTPVKVGGLNLSLRSLNPSDLFLIHQRTAHSTDEEFRLWWVAHSVWMVDGVNLFRLGEDPVAKIYSALRNMPRSSLVLLASQVRGLMQRQKKALMRVIPFHYERASREMWSSSRQDLSQGIAVGLGVNEVQKLWRMLNEQEDIKEREEREWVRFKFVAMTQAPKWVASYNERDKERRKNEAERRQFYLDKAFYESIGVDIGDRAKSVSSAKTFDDLKDEVRRWVSGELDEHDKVIMAYKQEKRDRLAALQEENARAMEEYYQAQAQEAEIRGQVADGLAAYLPSQIEEVLASSKGRKTVYENPYNEKVAKKARDFDLVPDALKREMQEEYGLGTSKPVMSLQEKIASRKVNIAQSED